MDTFPPWPPYGLATLPWPASLLHVDPMMALRTMLADLLFVSIYKPAWLAIVHLQRAT